MSPPTYELNHCIHCSCSKGMSPVISMYLVASGSWKFGCQLHWVAWYDPVIPAHRITPTLQRSDLTFQLPLQPLPEDFQSAKHQGYELPKTKQLVESNLGSDLGSPTQANSLLARPLEPSILIFRQKSALKFPKRHHGITDSNLFHSDWYHLQRWFHSPCFQENPQWTPWNSGVFPFHTKVPKVPTTCLARGDLGSYLPRKWIQSPKPLSVQVRSDLDTKNIWLTPSKYRNQSASQPLASRGAKSFDVFNHLRSLMSPSLEKLLGTSVKVFEYFSEVWSWIE